MELHLSVLLALDDDEIVELDGVRLLLLDDVSGNFVAGWICRRPTPASRRDDCAGSDAIAVAGGRRAA
jgi:hypothetical protein